MDGLRGDKEERDVIVTTNINAYVARANLFNPIIIAEDDESSHRLIAQIMVDGEKLTMQMAPSDGHSISLHYVRADGQVGSQNGSIVNGKMSFDLPDEMFELDDLVRCDIMYSYNRNITTHSLSVQDGEIIVTENNTTTNCPLRTGTFYINSQLRVITEHEGGEI